MRTISTTRKVLEMYNYLASDMHLGLSYYVASNVRLSIVYMLMEVIPNICHDVVAHNALQIKFVCNFVKIFFFPLWKS